MKERLVLKMMASQLFNAAFIRAFYTTIYKDINRKLCLSFNGSKGYISTVTMSCEGQTGNDNTVDIGGLFAYTSVVEDTCIEVYFSEKKGIRLISLFKRETRSSF